jgi:uncharacterized protein (DUF1501 family)
MASTRRDFLKGSLSTISLAFVGGSGLFLSNTSAAANSRAGNERILLVIELEGGNDGLNTIVPYSEKAYYAARPTLAIAEESLLKIDNSVGFNPALARFKSLYDENLVAVIQNVGYPKPDTSHFRSQMIYYRADPDTQERTEKTGWLGRYADLKLAQSKEALAIVNFGQSLTPTLMGERVVPPSIGSFDEYPFATDPNFTDDHSCRLAALKQAFTVNAGNAEFRHIQKHGLQIFNISAQIEAALKAYPVSREISYQRNLFSKQLQMAAQLINGGLKISIIYFKFAAGTFDTHANQQLMHTRLLNNLSQGLSVFYQDLKRLNRADDLLVMVFTEFGRRLAENNSGGTDHGSSGPLFIIGNSVKGGLYGSSPNLKDLDATGNTKYDIDFRAVYSTILNDWLATDANAVLGAKYENIGFLQK